MHGLVRFVKVAFPMLLIGLLLGGSAGCASECAESQVDWIYSLDEALSKAQSSNKMVMVDFYASWCPPCKDMDCKTYSDDELGAFINENFIPLKVNVDKSNLGSVYKIQSIPQVVFLSPEGTEIGENKEYRVVGYLPPDSFQGRLQSVLDAWNS